jgi:ribosomal protein L16 Arg81 hydroxylase
MGDELNGNNKSRLDRIEELLHVLVNEHIDFREEHRHLLKAQVLLYDSVQKLTEAQRKTEEKLAQLAVLHQDLAAAQRYADKRMAALIITVDDLIRRPPHNN